MIIFKYRNAATIDLVKILADDVSPISRQSVCASFLGFIMSYSSEANSRRNSLGIFLVCGASLFNKLLSAEMSESESEIFPSLT